MSPQHARTTSLRLLAAILRKLIFWPVPSGAKETIDPIGDAVFDRLQERLHDEETLDAIVTGVFAEADARFVSRCGDDKLRAAVLSKPLAALPSLRGLARRLDTGLDRSAIVAAVRDQLTADWSGELSGDQLDAAASLYVDCLDDALVAIDEQRAPLLHRQITYLRSLMRDMLARQDALAARMPYAQHRERRWIRPVAPRPSSSLIGRQEHFTGLVAELRPGHRAAITAALHGAPGIGKTFLAEHLAVAIDSDFTGGVLFERLGFGFRNAQNAMPVLRKWASYAFDGQALPDTEHVGPDLVRSLLSNHGPLFIVLDDVWDAPAIAPLLQALPSDACLLLTTRLVRVADAVRAVPHALDVLDHAESVALLRDRLGTRGHGQDRLFEGLAQSLGGHALALTIAAGTLLRRPVEHWPELVERMLADPRRGLGFGSITLSEEERRVDPVERVLAFSYFELSVASRERFRSLGALAPDAAFDMGVVAALWSCSEVDAEAELQVFADAGLLQRADTQRYWQMHGLLRAYALALLRRGQEDGRRCQQHAAVYAQRVKSVGRDHERASIPADYPQFTHAFGWALNNDVDLAFTLLNGLTPYQLAYQLAEDNLRWARALADKVAERLDALALQVFLALGRAHDRVAGESGRPYEPEYLNALAAYDHARRVAQHLKDTREYAKILNVIATTLRHLGSLPGQDRRERLHQALAAQDEALALLENDPELRARVLNDRAIVQRALADAPGESRRENLSAALASYEEVLTAFPESQFPIERAYVQNNIGNAYRELAECPGVPARTYLEMGLDQYDASLPYRTPDGRPIEHAMTMHNRAQAFRLLALLPSVDRVATLDSARHACDAAISLRRLGYGATGLHSALRVKIRILLDLIEARPDTAGQVAGDIAEALSELKTLPRRTSKLYDLVRDALTEAEVHLFLVERGESPESHLHEAGAAVTAATESGPRDPADIVRAAVVHGRIRRNRLRIGLTHDSRELQETLRDLETMMVVAEGAQSSVLLAELCVEYALTCATLSEVLPEDTELLDRARRELQRVEDLVNGGAIGVSPTRLERAREALKSHTT